MTRTLRLDHVGITVADLDTTAAFFVLLGLEVEGRTTLEGPFLDAVTGLVDARSEILVLRPPGGGAGVELATFARPASPPGSPDATAAELGLRSITLQVEDLLGLVRALAGAGYGLVGAVGEHEGTWRMASVRGPEGIVVSLAEQLPDAGR